MKTITKLSGTVAEAAWNEPYHMVSSVHVEPARNQFGIMQLGAAGLTLRVGHAVVGVPLSELMALLVPHLEAPATEQPPAAVNPKPKPKKTYGPYAGASIPVLASVALGLGLLFLAAAVWVARADTFVLAGGGMITVNNTTSNLAAVNVGTFFPPKGTYSIQNGGLTSTNALTVNVQFSLDGTNWTTLATYMPSGTNATTERFAPNVLGTIYVRSQIVTTNSVQVGATASF